MESLSRRATSNTCRRCLRSALSSSSYPPYSRAIRSFSQFASWSPQLASSKPKLALRKSPSSRDAKRSLSLFGRKTQDLASTTAKTQSHESSHSQRVLRSDDLFHSFTNSPIPEIRQRAAFIRQHAYCPHPDHRPALGSSGIPVSRHVDFECPDCGIPVYCSEQHWAEDYEAHLQICDTLRQINEDDHDLRSGRFFPEFEYAGPQMEEAVVNMTNWDTFLYTREFEAINDDRSMRQVTRLLTYPLTIGSILHELSPYNIRKGGRLTAEGLKSLSALRYTLHPPKTGGGVGIDGLRPEAPPVRIFILGARAESSLPRNVWVQLAHLFPRGKFHLIFVGPESMANRDDEFPLPPRTASNPFGAIVEDRVWPSMKISTIVDYYHTLHKTGHFYPYDPYFDCFVMFHPGLGHPASSHEWAETVPLLLETKAPIIVTGYTQLDMERDIAWVDKTCRGEFDMLMDPGENIFRSQRWDLNDLDPQDISCGNWGVWAFRGKRQLTETLNEWSSHVAAAAATAAVPLANPTETTSSSQSHHRSARPPASDFLSDKATAALIRRCLCARHLKDRGRSSPAPIEDLLPPLTSRNDVDLQLYALISIIIREFVQNWYNKITPDEAFVAEIVQVIAHCTRALEQRLRKVDLESLLFDELPELLATHIQAYRIATNPAAKAPLQTELHQIYHSLCPLPALSPVPRVDDPASIQSQADNETAYRQLLVHGVLAVLLPTEDLENECLTSLVGQILSELVIGNLVANKLSEPWLIWELLIMTTRLVRKKNDSNDSDNLLKKTNVQGLYNTGVSTSVNKRSWVPYQIFWSIVNGIFLAIGMIRLALSIGALSWSLPPRPNISTIRGGEEMNRDTQRKQPKSVSREAAIETHIQSERIAIVNFHIWQCIGDIFEVEARMPWLRGTVSMMQWIALNVPGRVAAVDGTLDR
ncbi:PXA domain-containing protein [Xylaria bambusicola]|uniref:PXA domain-containing protein n=1 Tax=Xylaria bambusicola TaxID=326684 RepID=UPI0020082144|nr:PXA domain-containing protein [Xylaria bambusicola]KAI0526229.1 PXA domain-containing protein [Xylaria bambusicola]